MNYTYAIFDTTENAYVCDKKSGKRIIFTSNNKAQKWIEEDLAAGNYPDKPSSVYQIHAMLPFDYPPNE